MKKEYDFEKAECWKKFKHYTLPIALHYITIALALLFAVIGLIASTGELDTSLVVLLCFAIVLGTVIFYAWYIEIRLENYRHNIIHQIQDNIQNCWSPNLTDEEKEELKTIITKDI